MATDIRPNILAVVTVLLAAVLLLGGCAGLAPTANQQTVAGVTDVEIAFKENCGEAIPSCLAHVRWRDGKESVTMNVTIDLSQGTFTYRRGNTRAFEGQAVRAAVEQAIAAEIGDVAPGAIDAVTGAVLKALLP